MKRMREIDQVILHSTATNPSWYSDRSVENVVKEIRRWHVEERKWSDVGYHIIIHRNGDTATGRPIDRAGAHCRGANKHSVGVALVGGRGGCADDKFRDNYTKRQEAALRQILFDLNEEYSISSVAGHNEYASKACPCFCVKDWL